MKCMIIIIFFLIQEFICFSDELRLLGSDIANVRDRLESTKHLAADAKGHVGNVHTDALALYRDIYALNIPTVDTDAMKNDAHDIATEVLFFNFQ